MGKPKKKDQKGGLLAYYRATFVFFAVVAVALAFPWLFTNFAAQMRSPDPSSPLGWVALTLMAKINRATIANAVQRLRPSSKDELWVELGAAHGFGLQEVFKQQSGGQFDWPQRIVAVEISQGLRQKYLEPLSKSFEGVGYVSNEKKRHNGMNPATLQQAKDNYHNKPDSRALFEIYGTDARDMRGFLRSGSVDKLLAVNVAYFLHPLEPYVDELFRVLKPGGQILLACKFNSIKLMPTPPFFNKAAAAVIGALEEGGFTVDVEEVRVDGGAADYTAIRASRMKEGGCVEANGVCK